jgi:hypothetical protein
MSHWFLSVDRRNEILLRHHFSFFNRRFVSLGAVWPADSRRVHHWGPANGSVADLLGESPPIAAATLHLNANRAASGSRFPKMAALISLVASMENVMPLPP